MNGTQEIALNRPDDLLRFGLHDGEVDFGETMFEARGVAEAFQHVKRRLTESRFFCFVLQRHEKMDQVLKWPALLLCQIPVITTPCQIDRARIKDQILQRKIARVKLRVQHTFTEEVPAPA